MRWLVQTGLAVERSPAQPDYSGLDIVAGTATLPDGRASTSKFSEWLAARLKDRAATWKQERLYKAERKNLFVKKNHVLDDSSDGKQKKGKADKGSGSAGAGAAA